MRTLYATTRRTIVWDGDSLTASPPSGGGAVSYPEFASQLIRGTPRIVNIAVSGSFGGHLGYDLSPHALAYVIMTGHNGLFSGETGETVLSVLSDRIALVRGVGEKYAFITKVFSSVLLSGAKETERNTANAGMAGLGADGVIDFEIDPRFSNPMNFTDGTHDGETFRKRRGEIAAKIINDTLGYTP